MIRVSIIGSGNVAEAFAVALAQSCGVELCEVAGRNVERLATISALTGCATCDLTHISPADLYILAVSDGVVSCVAEQINPPKDAIVVHCAGSVGIEHERIDGVIYPMQSFSAGRRVNFREAPLFIEAKRCEEVIAEVAKALSDNVIPLTSEQRRHLHLGAVFACNFVNAMLTACSEVVGPSGVSIDIYRPLVEETIAKAFAQGNTPQSAQTGAARRGDTATQERHLEMLQGDEQLRDIYQKISKYIWETSKRI